MRADKYFSNQFGSRTKAQEALRRELILRNGVPLTPKDEIREGDTFTILTEESRFVSNGGYKLERALLTFPVTVKGKTFADLGTSTGGFCDCLLQHGAKKVYCVDVGSSQLDASLAGDGRITVMDGTNARFLTAASFPEPIDAVTADLSFISLRLVLPAVFSVLKENGDALVLFKPQFECGGKGLGKSGILPVREHEKLLLGFYEFADSLGLAVQDIVNAPIRPKKNVEYMVWLQRGGVSAAKSQFLSRLSTFVKKN